jgi:hypothetical protein
MISVVDPETKKSLAIFLKKLTKKCRSAKSGMPDIKNTYKLKARAAIVI